MDKKINMVKREQKRIARIVTDKYKDYYLTGGTALAFYYQHRFSEDLDFFSQKYKRQQSDEIMSFISKKTGYKYMLDAEQNKKGLVPMKVYFMEIKEGHQLKIDFVQDYVANLKKPKKGLHSIEDIYYRKIIASIGIEKRKSITGTVIATGRQTAKDFFDIYYLSKHHKPVSEFFLEHFSPEKAERFTAWYRGFNRTDLKLELLDLVENIDTAEVIRYLDEQILRILPGLIER